MACADDTVIFGWSLASMKEGVQLLDESSKKVGLVVNEGKTNYTSVVPKVMSNIFL